MSKSVKTGVAKLIRVTHDKDTDKVFVTFEVVSNEYKDLVFRLSRNDNVDVIIRGDELDLQVED